MRVSPKPMIVSGRLAVTPHRDRLTTRWRVAAYNLIRLPKPLTAPS
jgi:hypothetical protein